MNTALLVIDVQTGFFESDPPVHDAANVLGRIRGLVDQARAAGVPVVYVRHDEGPEADWPIHPTIAPQPDDPVISKMTPDSFYETDLKEHLTQLDIKHVVLCGCATEYCIDTTTRSAFGKGYQVTLAKDAHSTFGSSLLDAPTMIAHHSDVLRGFATVVNVNAIYF